MDNRYRILDDRTIETPLYRYLCETKTRCAGSRSLTIVQLNPSDGGRSRSDPTMGKVSIWAFENKFKSVVFLNLFAYRTKYPSELNGISFSRLLGPKNDDTINQKLSQSTKIVLAWGEPKGNPILGNVAKRVKELRDLIGRRHVYRVGDLVGGVYPRHGRGWNQANRRLHKLKWSELE